MARKHAVPGYPDYLAVSGIRDARLVGLIAKSYLDHLASNNVPLDFTVAYAGEGVDIHRKVESQVPEAAKLPVA